MLSEDDIAYHNRNIASQRAANEKFKKYLIGGKPYRFGKIGELFDNHTLYIIYGPLTVSQIRESIKTVIDEIESKYKGIDKNYTLNVPIDKNKEPLGWCFCHFRDPRIYNLLTGYTVDGKERYETKELIPVSSVTVKEEKAEPKKEEEAEKPKNKTRSSSRKWSEINEEDEDDENEGNEKNDKNEVKKENQENKKELSAFEKLERDLDTSKKEAKNFIKKALPLPFKFPTVKLTPAQQKEENRETYEFAIQAAHINMGIQEELDPLTLQVVYPDLPGRNIYRVLSDIFSKYFRYENMTGKFKRYYPYIKIVPYKKTAYITFGTREDAFLARTMQQKTFVNVDKTDDESENQTKILMFYHALKRKPYDDS